MTIPEENKQYNLIESKEVLKKKLKISVWIIWIGFGLMIVGFLILPEILGYLLPLEIIGGSGGGTGYPRLFGVWSWVVFLFGGLVMTIGFLKYNKYKSYKE